jgi:predicted secreted protein
MKDEAISAAEEQLEAELQEQIKYMNAGISRETLDRMKKYIANAGANTESDD